MRQVFRNIIIWLCFYSVQAFACPDIGRLPDYNCDTRLKLVFLGDSVVYGTGDTDNGGKGGYVSRVASALHESLVTNFGLPGQRTQTLLEDLEQELSRPKLTSFGNTLINADTIILDLGRNDFWINFPPIRTFRNLKRARNLIVSNALKRRGYSPMVVISLLTVPDRAGQSTWVRALNKLLLPFNTAEHPTNGQFEKLGRRYLSSDHLHPSSKGYARDTVLILNYILGALISDEKSVRTDLDFDGVYDYFETLKFGTDPTVADTDGDGHSDGEEIFALRTDPLAP